MAQISDANSNHGVVLDIKDSDLNNHNPTPSSVPKTNEDLGTSPVPVLLIQKVIAELVGTYFLIFAGCATIEVDLDEENVVTLLGKAVAWGLAVMVLVYSVGHISGPHFNPAITIAFASCQKFPWKQVPIYISAQVVGSTLASGTLRLIFNGKNDHFVGSAPKGSDVQSLVMEFIITLFLMFVVSGVAADNRAVKELAGLVIGATISLNILVGGSTSGASMNPARSLGPAIVWKHYKGLWIYIVGPTSGAVGGAWLYNIFRPADKSLQQDITKTRPLHRGSGRVCSAN
ncbi:hypothetical protein RHSIM_Rhsim13G0192200 [Rhododendron simsii]|uniref:Uncharacterized protein n=1 Tax=Rhododendron simsii TaxID=118357 RepID=A0A834FXQ4_RHOSS|nr:hypothetical protein RHSIM_Rhsim13G0192200 [Rhododendron simsii]